MVLRHILELRGYRGSLRRLLEDSRVSGSVCEASGSSSTYWCGIRVRPAVGTAEVRRLCMLV